MAKVTVQVHGAVGAKIVEDVETVQDVLDQLNLDGKHTVMVNDETATNDQELEDFQFLVITQSVKGGA